MYGQNLKILVESEGARRVESTLGKLIREKKLRLAGANQPGAEVHLDELYEAFVGLENLELSRRQKGFVERPLIEEVKVSAFSNITGELISSMLIDAYEHNSLIADALVGRYPTKFRDERIAGFSASDAPKEVKEGDSYEDSGIAEKYITLGTAVKMGRIISITEEAVYYDQTGQLVDRAEGIGEMAALDREKAILKAVTGAVNRYYPSGTETALYAAAPYLVASNPLTDWTSIQSCLLTGFDAMTDENGERINSRPKAVLVPSALLFTAKNIINATQILGKTPTSGTAGTTAQARETLSPNVVENYQIISSPQVSAVQSSNGDTNWFMGDFQKQFRWKEVWPLQTFREAQGSIVQFERDIVSRFKVRYFGNAFVMDTKYVVKNQSGA